MKEKDRALYAPCPTCKQYSHSIGADAVSAAFNHFQTMIAHPLRGTPMGHAFDETTRDAAQVLMSLATPSPVIETEGSGERFWLVVHEPGCVPERKGPWVATGMKTILRDFIEARPNAYLHVLRVDALGDPVIDHGPEVLQMLDGRSMSVGRRHNARTLAAHTAAAERSTDREAVADYRDDLARALFQASYGMSLVFWSDETRDYWLKRADAALRPVGAENVREQGEGA